MPLSEAAPRRHLHDRHIECQGFQRDDGLWDIEGHLVDTKTYSFDNRYRGTVEPGTPVHEMWLRLTVDDSLVIQEAEAVTEYGPFPICPDITPRFAELKGLKIGPGWRRDVQRRLGGVHGCTHLVELLTPLATTAYQTILPRRSAKKKSDARKQPALLNSCHAFAADSPVVRDLWPEFYTGDTVP